MTGKRQPIRWLVLATGLPPYTLEVWERVAARENHQVLIVHLLREGEIDTQHYDSRPDAKHVELVPVSSHAALPRIVAKALRWRPDWVICGGYVAPHIVGIAALIRLFYRSTRVLYASDTNVIAEARRLSSPGGLARWGLRRALLPTLFPEALSLGLTNDLAHSMIGIRRTVALPLLGVPTREPMSAERSPWETLPRPLFACVARLAPVKNIGMLVSAWKRLPAALRTGSLVIIGDGPDRNALEGQTEASDSVHLVGAIPYWQLGPWFATFDALLLPSVFEPWGIVVTEALCAGVPVLATSEVGAAVSLAASGTRGVMLAPVDQDGFGRALAAFVKQLPTLGAAAAASAREMQENYSFDAIADRLAAFAEAADSRSQDHDC